MHLQRLPHHHKDKAGACVEYVHGIDYIRADNPEHSCSEVCMSRQVNGLQLLFVI